MIRAQDLAACFTVLLRLSVQRFVCLCMCSCQGLYDRPVKDAAKDRFQRQRDFARMSWT